MSELSLTPIEIDQVKASWKKISNKKDFFNELYLNLIEKNTGLSAVFNHDYLVINQHANIFGDCFGFIINNLEDYQMIDEFIYQFVQENQRFANMATKYLEPMGNSLISTLRNNLPNDRSGTSSSVLELIWVKVYVFFANTVLQYEDEITSETNSLLEIDVPPLNISRDRRQSVDTMPTPSPPPITQQPQQQKEESRKPTELPVHNAPVIGYDNSKPAQVLDKFNSIEIDLKSNDKYKGFRRSMDVAQSPVKVAIPTASTFQKTVSSTLSTTTTTSTATAIPQSNMSSTLKSMLADEDEYFKSPKPSFDPRRRRTAGSSGYTSPLQAPSTPKLQSSASSFNEKQFESPRMNPGEGFGAGNNEETDGEEFVTPGNSRRGSFSESYPASSLLAKLRKFQDPADVDVEDDDEEPESKSKDPSPVIENNSDDSIDVPSFDPRQRRRMNADLNKQIPSPESSEVDELEEEDLFINKIKAPASKQQQQQQQQQQHAQQPKQSVPERSLSRGGITGGTFDYQSFGLKGLAPIVEDDDVSSKYESDGESAASNRSHEKLSTKLSNVSSTDNDFNSRTSSLSLHNSDYKSSFVSSNGETDSLGLKGGSGLRHEVHSRATSVATDDFQFAVAPQKQQQQQQQKSAILSNNIQQSNHGRNNSIYSLGAKSSMSTGSLSSGGRASLGFMRSSFVLKKEMETQGFNHPENVVMPSNRQLASVPVSPKLNNKSSSNSLQPPRNSVYLSNKANSVSSFGNKRSYNNSQSGFAVDSPSDSAYNLLNSFSQSSPVVPPPVPKKDNNYNNRNSRYGHLEEPKKKSGLLGRLSSIFSSRSSSPKSTPSNSRKNSVMISNPSPISSGSGSGYTVGGVAAKRGCEMTAREFYQQQQKQPSPLFANGSNPSVSHIPPIIRKVESSGCSITNSSTNRRTNSSTIGGGSASGNSGVYGYKYGSHHDLSSVHTGETSTSGFSMLKNTNKGDVKFVPPLTRHTRKGNKYNVKKVPYNIWA